MPSEYAHVMREIRRFLKSDGFERVKAPDSDSAAWESPGGGFRVVVRRNLRRDGLTGYVERGDGTPIGETTWADTGWLDEMLP